MTVLLHKQLTKTDLGALSVKNIRITLGKAQVRAALCNLLDCARPDDLSGTDQALEALATTAVPLAASDPSGSAWELLLKSTYRAGSQAFFIERAGEFLRSCDAQPGDVWELTRHSGKLEMRVIKAEAGPEPSITQAEDATDEACSSDVSDQQAIPACVRGPAAGALMSPPPPAAGPALLPPPPFAPAAPRPIQSSPPGGLSDTTHYGSTSSLGSYPPAASAAAAVAMLMGPPSGPLADRPEHKRSAPHDAALPAHDAKRAVPPGGPASATPSPSAPRPAAPAQAQAPPYALVLPAAAFAGQPAAQQPARQQGQLIGDPQGLQAPGYYFAVPAPHQAAWQGGWAVAQPPFYFAAAPPPAAPQQHALQAQPAPPGAAGGGAPPQHILVTCNGLQGFLDVNDMMIVVGAGGGQHQVRPAPRAVGCA
ncbi:hypothetical protein MNEG_6572 [Monoraphidium neglectum]|uniref:Uncharacterized protein n=1 Tax=Monoraphidium neglectum TaxID=145388 RepID=A0A0D2L296_9CHLO|nr:hypothetical protein MNEG_6572 [Monoraphidium neglectum]KIZ01394.1 hypothetical protein MNEG_6572 [Monoraphidium neglectum]|eukprot:XP_013900413.1 hypothetical protein MNEG_6572 [Monoraphidium neglectum]